MERLFVGNTDRSWFNFLAQRPALEEVNFWQPGGRNRFKALRQGELFLFRLKAPINRIAGGGYLEWADKLPVSQAWAIFEQGNGVSSVDELVVKITHYRGASMPSPHLSEIGCIILRDAFFWEPQDWIPVPADYAPNIVTGKTYVAESETGALLLEAVSDRQSRPLGSDVLLGGSAMYEVPGGFNVASNTRRIGQGAFRGMVLETYERRCAVTGGKVLPILEAAHIMPVSKGGLNHIHNGILMRSDVHALYDLGFLTVTPELTVRASRRLRDDFNNGEDYRRLDGRTIWVPPDPRARPNRDILAWHTDTVFLR